ncbi:hypothetical protein VTJ49DRAFT_5757 [Mycothermus thermophilus]|uniref:Uncharacterized protein n=1 Tax=Humicola insolens TaxID=85995 RepID=A0ABR3V2H3_HUMIN
MLVRGIVWRGNGVDGTERRSGGGMGRLTILTLLVAGKLSVTILEELMVDGGSSFFRGFGGTLSARKFEGLMCANWAPHPISFVGGEWSGRTGRRKILVLIRTDPQPFQAVRASFQKHGPPQLEFPSHFFQLDFCSFLSTRPEQHHRHSFCRQPRGM